MSKRDTGTGNVLEQMVPHSLEKGGYTVVKSANVGKRPSGNKHIVDAIAIKGNQKFLISLKWQQVNGTAEQKIPYEVISLLKIMKDNATGYSGAYIVLGGEGWTLKDFYTNNGLNEYMNTGSVKIVTFENFIYLANKGMLATNESLSDRMFVK